MPLLELQDISKTYEPRGRFGVFSGRRDGGGIEAVHNISFAVEPDQALGIVGESGSGKTTLAMLMAGLEKPSGGRIMIEGTTASRKRAGRLQRASRVQLVWQDPIDSVDPRYQVKRAVAEPLRIHGEMPSAAIEAKVGSLTAEVGLGEELLERYPGELSGGQVQRVVIARALALDPDLVICDEPASALDVQTKVGIAELLMRLRDRRGLAYVIIGHDLPLMRKMTDKLIVMYRGRLMESGPTAQVLDKPQHPYTRLLLAADPSSFIPAAAGAETVANNPIKLEADSTDGCIFFSRCQFASAICRNKDILPEPAGEGRLTACVRYEDQILPR